MKNLTSPRAHSRIRWTTNGEKKNDAKVFGGDVVASVPLVLEFGTFLCKNLGQTLHCRCDQSVRLFDRTAGLLARVLLCSYRSK
jgi:hypothetical protein